jgi:P pilus assembly chaperone PapD
MMFGMKRFTRSAAFVGALILQAIPAPATAALTLSQVIVDLVPGRPLRDDIEAWNDTNERMYIVAEPSLIANPGLASEKRLQEADPEKLGLLVTPTRMILEPGQRKILRVAAITPAGPTDRIYRVTIKPVSGGAAGGPAGLKILLGYDVLVVVRAAEMHPDIVSQRANRSITLTNRGNTNVELFDGQQCDAEGKHCVELPSKRLYPGADWVQVLPGDGPLEYTVKAGGQVTRRKF